MQLYCAACVPKQVDFERKYPGEKLYREESILNDQQLMALLGRFQYEHPNKEGFAELDRVIITENAKLQPYKKTAKKPLPLRCKAALLTELFPAVHRMENRKFPSYRAMRAAVRAKAAAIAEGYMNLTETEQSQLQDNFDVLVDRTPMHAKISSQQQRSLMPPPVTPFRPVTPERVSSLGDMSSMSSESRVDALRMGRKPYTALVLFSFPSLNLPPSLQPTPMTNQTRPRSRAAWPFPRRNRRLTQLTRHDRRPPPRVTSAFPRRTFPSPKTVPASTWAVTRNALPERSKRPPKVCTSPRRTSPTRTSELRCHLKASPGSTRVTRTRAPPPSRRQGRANARRPFRINRRPRWRRHRRQTMASRPARAISGRATTFVSTP